MTLSYFLLPPALAHHPLAETLGWVLLHFLWEGALVAGALVLALALMRRRPPAERYAVSLAALVLLALLPVLTWQALPRPVEAVPPAGPTAGAVGQAARVPAFGRAAGAFRSAPAPRLQAEPAAMVAAMVAAWVRRCADRSAPLVALGWLLGVAVLAVRMAGGWAYTLRLKRDATPPAQRWQRRFHVLAREMNLAPGAAALLLCGRIEGPAVAGWWRPVVLAPTGFLTGLPPAQVEAILRHELAHIRRHDYLVGLAQAVVETLLFYHPAVWWVSGRVRTLREHCCDDYAARATDEAEAAKGRLTYARALAALDDWRSAAPFAPAAGGGSLVARIRRLVEPGAAPGRSLGWPGAAAALAAVLVLGACAAGGAVGKGAAAGEEAKPPPAPAPPVAPAAPPAARRDTVPRPPRVTIITSRDTAQLGRDSLRAFDAAQWRQWGDRQGAWAKKWQAWGDRWQEQMENSPRWAAWQQKMQQWGDRLHAALPEQPDSLHGFFQGPSRFPGGPEGPAVVFAEMPAPPDAPAFAPLDSLRALGGDDAERVAVLRLPARHDTLPGAPQARLRVFSKKQAAARVAEHRALTRAADRLDARADALAEQDHAEAARALREESRRLRRQRERSARVHPYRSLQRRREPLGKLREQLDAAREQTKKARRRASEQRLEAWREQAARMRERAEGVQEKVEDLRGRFETRREEGVPEEQIDALRRQADALEEQALTLRRASRQVRRRADRLERKAKGAHDDRMQDID